MAKAVYLSASGYVVQNGCRLMAFEIMSSSGNEGSVTFAENGGTSGTTIWKSEAMIGADTNARYVDFSAFGGIEVKADLYATLSNCTVSVTYTNSP